MDMLCFGPPMSVAEVEAAHMVSDRFLGPDPVPFGHMNKEWRALLAEMRPGDELREFISSPESWENLAGQMGVALIRDGREIASIVTMLN